MACALLAAVSCESKLEIPQKGVVAYENFYANDNDAQSALNNIYVNFLMNVAGTAGIYNAELMLLNYSADDVVAAGGDYKDHDGFRIFDEFTYDDQAGALNGMYANYYKAIYHTNLVISNFTNENKAGDEPKWTSALTEKAVAEARVMRAYLHMMAALTWDCPPIVDRLQEGDDLPKNAESQEQILSWVVAECEKAIASGALPERAGVGDKNSTTIMTKGFAQFTAGKAAVCLNDMATARKYLGDLINSGKYALVPSEDFWTNFHVAGDGNAETIFEPNFLEDPNFTNNAWGSGSPITRGRWMVANVLCWRTDALGSEPNVHAGFQGWNGGAIQEDFAKKFLEHDGDSPRRLATFLTADEWLYEMDWLSDSTPMNTTFGEGMGYDDKGNFIKPVEKEENGEKVFYDKAGKRVDDKGYLLKKNAEGKWVADTKMYTTKESDMGRGIKSASGLFSHGAFFEWKHMVYVNPPKILTGGKKYPSDHVTGLGPASNQTNFNVARYAEALLLYAEACVDSPDAAKGLAALNQIQQRSGSGKVSSALTMDAVMEEKQYEMWFENVRFHDLVRWSKRGLVNLDQIFNKSGLLDKVPVAYDEFFVFGKPGFQKEHKIYVEYMNAPQDFEFVTGKHEYFTFPYEYKTVNPNLQDVNGWK